MLKPSDFGMKGADLTVTFKDIVDHTERTAEFFSQNAAEDFIAELGDRFVECNFRRTRHLDGWPGNDN